jgi:hypothetical protein
MFVIDNSGSMSGSSGQDRNGDRFRVTRALIDSIYSVYEKAEVGVILFTDALQFDSNNDTRLEPFTGPTTTVPRQSFMPLIRLDSAITANGFYNAAAAGDAGTTYRGLLRSLFDVPANVNNAATVRVNRIGGQYTDISLAFEAAVQAFKRTSIPAENRYIIFLSDGEPNVQNNAAAAARWPRRFNYVLGEFDDAGKIPTTYTVFLNNSNNRAALPITLDTVSSIPRNTNGLPANFYQVIDGVTGISAPATVAGMTYNIRKNGYSATNESSDIWLLEANFQNMLNLMMENIVSPMLTKTEGMPTKMVVKNATVSDSSNSLGTGGFSFTKPLGLVGDTTTITMGITYNVDIKEIVDGDTTTTNYPDSLREFTFRVVRSENTPTSDIEVINCKEKPSLKLQYNGTKVDTVKDYMSSLQVVFDQGGNSYSQVTVLVMNTEGTVYDTVTINLTKNGNEWRGDFSRVVADIIKNDKILQHKEQDSIVVVFRNPLLPLDTARIAVPFISTHILFYEKAGNPSGLTRFPDTVNVTAGFEMSIFAKFFGPDGGWLPEYETDASMTSKIKWTASDPQNVVLSDATGYTTTFKSTAANKVYTVTATFTHGETVITRNIYVKVDPIIMALYEKGGDPFNPVLIPALPDPSSGGTITVVAGVEKEIFAKLFDIDNNWISGYETDSDLRSKITWSVEKPAEVLPAAGNSAKFRSTVARRTYQVTATLTLQGFSTSASVLIKVDPAEAKYLDIVNDIENVDPNNRSNFNEVSLEKDHPSVKVWVVERDEFGNLVGLAQNPVWSISNDKVTVSEKNSDGSFIIERGKGAGDDTLTVNDGNGKLAGDELRVIIIGELSVAVGPNPFAPGKNTIGELPPQVREYYKDIITAYGGEGKSGILIAVESPRPIKTGSLKIVIYDAVGNVVFTANTKGELKENNTYGFVWDGKNNRGRAVGPGTYLLKMSGVQDNGQKFQPPPKKIGVTKAK